MSGSTEGKQEPLQKPTSSEATPPAGLGVYDRPERNKLSVPAVIALFILALIIVIIVWQLWL